MAPDDEQPCALLNCRYAHSYVFGSLALHVQSVTVFPAGHETSLLPAVPLTLSQPVGWTSGAGGLVVCSSNTICSCTDPTTQAAPCRIMSSQRTPVWTDVQARPIRSSAPMSSCHGRSESN